MSTDRKRRCYEDGHRRKYLVVADGSAEADIAMMYCASRIARTGGDLVLLHIIEPQDFGHWMGVRATELEEEANKAKALFRLMRRKLGQAGFDHLVVDERILQGKNIDVITKVIEDDEDIAILVLGAATDGKGPGPLITQLVSQRSLPSFPIPINIVPGHLSIDEVQALA
jgi:hypothetical protein